MLPNHTYIDRYIRDGQNDSYSLSNFYESVLIANQDKDHIIRVPIGDFFIEHMSDFEHAIQIYNIPQTMFYKPKTLSMEIYGTTELWLAILRVNGMKNISEFHKSVILVWNPNTLRELIDVFFKRKNK